MRKFVAAAIVLIMLQPSAAQELADNRSADADRAETIAMVSAAMAQIQSEFNRDAIYASSDPGIIEAAVQAAIEQMLNLRNALVDNPHVRLAGFSVGVPAGISADFEFPEGAD